MSIMRNCCAAAVVVCAAISSGAHAQSYPSKTVRWVVPFPPGGGTDTISRTLAQKLTEAWGQQVVADNRPGSGGTIGLALATKMPADGYACPRHLANVAIAPAL